VAPPEMLDHGLPSVPDRFLRADGGGRSRRSFELWTRFLFSCLVDADSLDTEAFLNGDRRRLLPPPQSLSQLRGLLDEALESVMVRAEETRVNRARAEVLAACRAAAELPPGAFSLTVPTGGGKTLSAMAFALAHAENHGLERVIVAIPYTSIIEQNAAVYRGVFGAESVIEHHASLDPNEETLQNRMASENWDAPIIVTTNVQLFESLFANTRSRCRKLHNVVRSVLLLDEIQTLPSRYLQPIVEVLGELTEHYGCSVVLSSATQPALLRREALPAGLDKVREIVPDPSRLFRNLERVEIDWERLTKRPVSWEELGAELEELEKVLVVVHRRQDARELAELLPEEGLFHLSALLCAAHRKARLEEIREHLEGPGPCRVVSTQLIEAGVDIDFPVVYRALAGLDSVAQAAGRCNREGRFRRGRVVLFLAPTSPPAGTLRKGLEVTSALLAERGPLDLADPNLYEEFFRQLYFREDLDGAHVQPLREGLEFASVARKVRLIEDGYTQPMVVPYGQGPERFIMVLRHGPSRDLLRALQPFLVNIPELDFQRLRAAGALHGTPEEAPVLYALTAPYARLYDDRFGMLVPEILHPEPESLVV
ncbi:MAG TPA: CRISPR-associated helicase Cas3', partial [Thermoanaerobaculia bacterium]|nr:CRISPR-associated helicase Cas3' [Thermoanaerobaculia bacterium]